MNPHRAFLALGSNVDPDRHYPAAVRLLAGLGRVAAVSPVYETVAVGMPGAAAFLNGAVLLESIDAPETCKSRLRAEVEDALGRSRAPTDGWRDRTIDVDIALWDDLVGEILGRPVPDPDITTCLHLAQPLADLAPDLRLPGDGRTLAAVARALRRRGDPLPRRRADIELEI